MDKRLLPLLLISGFFVMYTEIRIIREVNIKLPEGDRNSYLDYFASRYIFKYMRIARQHKALYPGSRLRLAQRVSEIITVLSLLWLFIHLR